MIFKITGFKAFINFWHFKDTSTLNVNSSKMIPDIESHYRLAIKKSTAIDAAIINQTVRMRKLPLGSAKSSMLLNFMLQ